jgi:hypothetical protein
LIDTLLVEDSRLQLNQPGVVLVPTLRLRLVRHRKQVSRLKVIHPQLVDYKVATTMVRDSVLIRGSDYWDGRMMQELRMPDVVGDWGCQVVEGPMGGILVGHASL